MGAVKVVACKPPENVEEDSISPEFSAYLAEAGQLTIFTAAVTEKAVAVF